MQTAKLTGTADSSVPDAKGKSTQNSEEILLPNFKVLPRQPNEASRPWTYRVLLYNILNLFLPPGSSLVETEVRQILGVSRTPIREAFAQLAQEEFVTIIPQKGTYVTRIDMSRVLDLRYIRMRVESGIVRLVAEKMNDKHRRALDKLIKLQEKTASLVDFEDFMAADDALHRLFYEIAGRPGAWEIVTKTTLHHYRSRILGLRVGRRQPRLIVEHKRIVDALKNGNAAKAVREVKAHLSEEVWNAESLMENYPDYLIPPK